MNPTVIDFHSHVLPKMDDGSRSPEMSLQMLHQMYATGTDLVVATPHYYGNREDVASFLQRRAHTYEVLSEAIDEQVPRVILGAEVAFYSGLLSDDYSSLCTEGTNTLLLEMPHTSWTHYELNVISELCLNRDIQVVLAHWERYAPYQENNMILSQIQELPVSIQINAGSLLPLRTRKKWLDLFSAGKAHLIGSDCHDPKRRAPNLDKARTMIRKKLGIEVLNRIDLLGAELAGISERNPEHKSV